MQHKPPQLKKKNQSHTLQPLPSDNDIVVPFEPTETPGCGQRWFLW